MEVESIKCKACGAPLGHVIARCPYCGGFTAPAEKPRDDSAVTGSQIKRDLSKAYTSIRNSIVDSVNKRKNGSGGN
ncbi:MAG: hypothetical protein LBS99_01585 [Clostridiales bacterium]|jgi:hypothetical protein|nr:hypothetical protein [Clostridiales bacterium]